MRSSVLTVVLLALMPVFANAVQVLDRVHYRSTDATVSDGSLASIVLQPSAIAPTVDEKFYARIQQQDDKNKFAEVTAWLGNDGEIKFNDVRYSSVYDADVGRFYRLPNFAGNYVEIMSSLPGWLITESLTTGGYDVILWIGQSQGMGYWGITGEHANLNIEDSCIQELTRSSDAYWDKKIHTVPSTGRLSHNFHNNDPQGYSPGVPFAQAYIADNGCRRKVMMVAAAQGSTGLASIDILKGYHTYPFWQSTSGQEGLGYLDTVDRINAALALHPDNRLVAIGWQQGETDGFNGVTGAAYTTALSDLITNLKAAIISPTQSAAEIHHVPFIIGGFEYHAATNGAGTYIDIYNAQKAFPSTHPYTAYFDTSDQNLAGGSNVHWTSKGSTVMGTGMYSMLPFAIQNDEALNIPGIPSNLSGTVNALRSIDMQWTDSPDDTAEFTVRWRVWTAGDTNSWVEVQPPTPVNAGLVFNTGISDSTVYEFAVKAGALLGDSAYSSSVTVDSGFATPAITGLTAEANNNQLDISWAYAATPVPSLTSATLEYKVDAEAWPGTPLSVAIGSGDTAASITGLTNSTLYTVRVTTTSITGTETASTTGTPQDVLSSPNPSTITIGTIDTQGEIPLSWSNAGGNPVATYLINYRATDGTTSPITSTQLVTGVSGLSYLATGLAAATEYAFTVTPGNSEGTAAESAEVTATTLAAPAGGSIQAIEDANGVGTVVMYLEPGVANFVISGGVERWNASIGQNSRTSPAFDEPVWDTSTVWDSGTGVGTPDFNPNDHMDLFDPDAGIAFTGGRSWIVRYKTAASGRAKNALFGHVGRHMLHTNNSVITFANGLGSASASLNTTTLAIPSPTNDDWHTVVVTCPNGNNYVAVSLYLDAYANTNTWTGSSDCRADGSQPYLLGRFGGDFFDGSISHFAAINKVLTQAEIESIFTEFNGF